MADQIPDSAKMLTVTQADVTDADRAAVTSFHTIQIKRIIAGDKTMGDNRDVIEQAFARHRIEAEQRATRAALPDPVKLAERFCATPLPESVCADLCATQPGPGRYGTNLMTVAEASEVFRAAISTFTRAAPPAMDREAVERVKAMAIVIRNSVISFGGVVQESIHTRAADALDAYASTLSADAIRQGEGVEEDVAFLREAARYFANRSTDGEDRAHWSNVANSESCERIANHLSTLSADAIRQGEGGTTANCAGVPDGWKLVPTEPTGAMVDAACDRVNPIGCCLMDDIDAAVVYRAMVAATPASHASDGGEA